MVVVRSAIVGVNGEVDRHLHFAGAPEVDLLARIRTSVLHAFHGIIQLLAGIDPLIEEPVEVHVGEGDEALTEILHVGVLELPLREIVLEGGGEEGVAQHVLQIEEHGGGLVVHHAVAGGQARELVAARVDRGQLIPHGGTHVAVVGQPIAGERGLCPLAHVGVIGRLHHQRVLANMRHAHRFDELREALVQHGAVGLVVAHHAEEPVVPDLVHEEDAVVRFLTAVQGQHGVFHAVPRIGHHHLRIAVHADVLAMHLDALRGVFRSVLPFASVRLLGHGDALDPVPLGLADAVGGIGREGEVMHVLRVVFPHFADTGLIGRDHGWCFVPRLVLEVGDVEFLPQLGGHHLFRVLQPAGGLHHHVVGHVQRHVEAAEVAVELVAEVLLRVPTELTVVHTKAGVPLRAVEVLEAPCVEELHPAHPAPVGDERVMEGRLGVGQQRFR